MLIGRPDRFAIEAEPREREGTWIWGGFRFWIGNQPVGNWDDATALQYCCGWIRKLQQPRDCTEPTLAGSPPDEVFRMLVEPVMGPGGIADPASQPIPFAYERFHLQHVGMSSFESYVILLLKDDKGGERILWRRTGERDIREHWLAPGEIERVAGEFCDAFERQWSI